MCNLWNIKKKIKQLISFLCDIIFMFSQSHVRIVTELNLISRMSRDVAIQIELNIKLQAVFFFVTKCERVENFRAWNQSDHASES